MFIPEKGNRFWYVAITNNESIVGVCTQFRTKEYDRRFKTNSFKTKKQATEAAKKIKKILEG